jgi:hypothetical protein
VALLAVSVAVVLSGCGAEPTSPSFATPSVATASRPAATPAVAAVPEAVAGSALAALEELAVKGRAPTTGYDREQFGPPWPDTDGNGCDTRNDMLGRDLSQADVDRDGCTVVSGWLADPYSRTWVAFVRGVDTSEAVQVDHVVALSDAWQKGAQQMSPGQRQRFANDPLNLLAVDGELNQQKGDGDAATWLPPNKAVRCGYVARQVAVKARYDLWVTSAERDAIARVLASCPEQPLPSGTDGIAVVPDERRSADTTVAPGPTRSPGAFADCTQAREAGAAPLRRGEPGYDPSMDGDGDGVACE